MNVLGEASPQLIQSPCERLSCLISCEGRQLGIDRRSGDLCSLGGGNRVERMRLSRVYERITYCPQTRGYFAIGRCAPGCIFVLDACFREIDCIRISLDAPLPAIEDIWFDGETRLLWVVTGARIYRFNCNGDRLGAFMTAPLETEYKAVCTYGGFVFVALVKGGCLSLVSYTGCGVYLERVSIGSGYTVCNLQAAACESGLCLRALAIRDHRFSVVLEVELAGEREETPPCGAAGSGGICVECETESPRLHATCRLGTPCPGNAPQGGVIE